MLHGQKLTPEKINLSSLLLKSGSHYFEQSNTIPLYLACNAKNVVKSVSLKWIIRGTYVRTYIKSK